MPLSATELANAMTAAHNVGDMEQVIALAVQGEGEADELVGVLLGSAQQAIGRIDDAIATFERLTQRWPDVSTHWNNLAVACRQRGDADAAEQAFLKAQSLAPDDAEVHYNLGLLYIEERRWLLARQTLTDAVELAPDFVDARLQGAYACHVCGDSQGEAAMLAGAADWPAQAAAQALTLAAMLATQDALPTALDVLNRAEQRLDACPDDPDYAALKLRLVARRIALYERSNQIERALRALAKLPLAALDALPPDARHARSEGWAVHAALAMREKAPDRAAALYRQMRELAVDHENEAAANFGLAAASDKQGQYEVAWLAAQAAHAAQLAIARDVVPELLVVDSRPLEMTQRVVTRAAYDSWRPLSSPSCAQSPVFVVGFPRSGTTLLEQMIDAHPDFQSMDERAFIHELTERMAQVGQAYPDDLATLTQDDADQLRALYLKMAANVLPHRGAQTLVDKNPLNMLCLPMIMRLFPNARIILCLRHPCDVLLSCYIQSFRSPAFMVLCSSLPRLAQGYLQAFEQWTRHVAIFAPRVLEWRYESVVSQFDENVARLGEFLEVADASSMAGFAQHAQDKRFISTPSYAQVTQGINQRAVNRWHAYREHFEPVLPMLKPLMVQLGYDE